MSATVQSNEVGRGRRHESDVYSLMNYAAGSVRMAAIPSTKAHI